MTRSIEAFQVYHFQKESLTNYLQVSSAGLSLLRRTIDAPNAPVLLGALVDACGVKHWVKGKRYNKAADQVDAGISALADLGVIQHVAAFDIFTRAAVQDLSRFSARARSAFPHLKHDHQLVRLSPANRWVSDHCCNDIAGRLGRLSQRLTELSTWTGWKPTPKLQATLALFDLVRSVRNCIAHGGGTVGSELEELAASKDISNALAAFRAGYTKGDLPPLPALVRRRPLGLQVVHAILFGAFLYEIAKEIRDYVVSWMDDDDFIDMAFYYSCIVEDHPRRTIRHRSVENRVGYFLSDYWRDNHRPQRLDIVRRLTGETVDSGGMTYWRVALGRHEALLAS
jgi:hypothetical protein